MSTFSSWENQVLSKPCPDQQQRQYQQHYQQQFTACQIVETEPRKKVRSKISEEHRMKILSTPLPLSIQKRGKYRARVAVRTVRLFNLVLTYITLMLFIRELLDSSYT
jgi:hypothetical protein